MPVLWTSVDKENICLASLLPSPALNKAGQELFLLGNVPCTNP